MVKCWVESAGSGSEPGKGGVGFLGPGSVEGQGRGQHGVRGSIELYFGSH
jgi:hypothetical protein